MVKPFLKWAVRGDGLCLPALVRVQAIAEYLGYNYGSQLIARLEDEH
jgi:hypothetical protein